MIPTSAWLMEKRRAAIDAEILRVLAGEVLLLDPTQVKGRFLQHHSARNASVGSMRAARRAGR